MIRALRPGLRLPDSLLLAISTPYARKGALFAEHQKHYGRDHDPILVWSAPTLVMNPTFNASLIDRAMADDPASAGAEYHVQFRGDVEQVFTREMLTPLIDTGRREYPADPLVMGCLFFDEAGGGVGADADSFAAAHATAFLDEEQRVCGRLDWLLELRPPFRHDHAIALVAARAQAAGLSVLVGDKFGGQYPAQEAAKHGLGYVPSPRTRSELYLALIPLVTSQRVRLLDHDKLLTQLTNLERRPGRNGRDTIDHGPTKGSHDDLANVAAGALLGALDAAEAQLVAAPVDRQTLADEGVLDLARELGLGGIGIEADPQFVPLDYDDGARW